MSATTFTNGFALGSLRSMEEAYHRSPRASSSELVRPKTVENDTIKVVISGVDFFNEHLELVDHDIKSSGLLNQQMHGTIVVPKIAIATLIGSITVGLLGALSLLLLLVYEISVIHPYLALILLVGGGFLLTSTVLALVKHEEPS